MDIFVLVLLLALYVIPEVLRRARKPKTYQYPQFPPADQQSESMPTNLAKRTYSLQSQLSAAVQPVEKVVTVDQTSNMNQMLDVEQPVELSNLAYGLVMAEILGPPRSRNKLGWKR